MCHHISVTGHLVHNHLSSVEIRGRKAGRALVTEMVPVVITGTSEGGSAGAGVMTPSLSIR